MCSAGKRTHMYVCHKIYVTCPVRAVDCFSRVTHILHFDKEFNSHVFHCLCEIISKKKRRIKAPVQREITIVFILPIIDGQNVSYTKKVKNLLLMCDKNGYRNGSPFSLTSLIDQSSSIHSPNVI